MVLSDFQVLLPEKLQNKNVLILESILFNQIEIMFSRENWSAVKFYKTFIKIVKNVREEVSYIVVEYRLLYTLSPVLLYFNAFETWFCTFIHSKTSEARIIDCVNLF